MKMESQLNDTYTQLITWFDESPIWVQIAAKKLLTEKESLGAEDISLLADACLRESKKESVAFSPVTLEDLSAKQNFDSFSISSISNVKGVNAIEQTEPLSFSEEGLVAILGSNGSGKSGYARMLKRASGNSSVQLLGNIYEKTRANPSCDITLLYDETEKTEHLDFAKQLIPSDLQLIDVFDTAAANQYIGGQSSPSYLPVIFSVLMTIVGLCPLVKAEIENMKSAHASSALPALPLEARGSEIEEQLSRLSHKSKTEAFNVAWTADDEKAMEDAIAFVNETSPEAKLKLNVIQMEAVDRVLAGITNLSKKLSESVLQEFSDSLGACSSIKKSQNDAAAILAGEIPLDVSGETWKMLWDAAVDFANDCADPLANLSGDLTEDTLCPLCQRPLGDEGLRNMRTLKQHAESKLSLELKNAETKVAILRQRISAIKPRTLISETDISLCNLEEAEVETIMALVVSFEELKGSVIKANGAFPVKTIDSSTATKLLEGSKKILSENADSLKEMLDDAAIKRQKTAIADLTAKKYLADNQTAIESEIERLAALDILGKAVKMTATNRISRKANELSEVLIAGEYIQAFQEELEIVSRGKISAELVKQKSEKGRIPYAIRLAGAGGTKENPDDILSEGEKRVVALAAFFAEARRTPAGCPLIFDDPICSLDEEYEEGVLNRIVIESDNRQVVVFTHRISVVSELERMTNDGGYAFTARQIAPCSDGIHKGNPVNEYLLKKKPTSRLNQIIGDELAKLKKAEDANDTNLARCISENACKHLRITIEACVEHVLIDSVVLRYRRDIQTKGKLKNLSKVTKADCVLLEDLMTKYSFSEHFAPYDEIPKYFDYQTLKTDCEMLANWIKDFAKRPIPDDAKQER